MFLKLNSDDFLFFCFQDWTSVDKVSLFSTLLFFAQFFSRKKGPQNMWAGVWPPKSSKFFHKKLPQTIQALLWVIFKVVAAPRLTYFKEGQDCWLLICRCGTLKLFGGRTPLSLQGRGRRLWIRVDQAASWYKIAAEAPSRHCFELFSKWLRQPIANAFEEESWNMLGFRSQNVGRVVYFSSGGSLRYLFFTTLPVEPVRIDFLRGVKELTKPNRLQGKKS